MGNGMTENEYFTDLAVSLARSARLEATQESTARITDFDLRVVVGWRVSVLVNQAQHDLRAAWVVGLRAALRLSGRAWAAESGRRVAANMSEYAGEKRPPAAHVAIRDGKTGTRQNDPAICIEKKGWRLLNRVETTGWPGRCAAIWRRWGGDLARQRRTRGRKSNKRRQKATISGSGRSWAGSGHAQFMRPHRATHTRQIADPADSFVQLG